MIDANKKFPFPAEFYSGKPNVIPLGSQAFSLGGRPLRYELEKNGWLDHLIVRISGQYDVSTATLVLLPRAPWNIIRKFTLQPSQGRQPIFDVGGWSIHLHNLLMRDHAPTGKNADIRTSGLDINTGRSAVLDTFPTGVATDQLFDLWYILPIHRSSYDPRGRLPLEVQGDTVLYVDPETEANLVTVVGNWAQDSLACDVWQVSYDYPPASPDVLQFDPRWLVTYEEREQVAAIGVNTIEVDPGGAILRAITTLSLNDLLTTSDDISSLALRADKTDLVKSVDPRAWYFMQKRRLGFALPDGVLAFDFDSQADADGAAGKVLGTPFEPSIGQWLSMRRVNNLRIEVTIPSGTTLGTAPRLFTTVARMEQVQG